MKLRNKYRGKVNEYADLVIHEMLPKIAELQLAKYCDVFCEPSIQYRRYNRNYSAAEPVRLSSGCVPMNFPYPVRRKWPQSLAQPQPITWRRHSTSAGSKLWRRAGDRLLSWTSLGCTTITACAKNMIEAGLAVVLTKLNPGSSPAIGTDFVWLGVCPNANDSAQAISATTINAGISLAAGQEFIGSLEAGKRANFVIHDCKDYRRRDRLFRGY